MHRIYQITAVKVLPPYGIRVSFSDGVVRDINLSGVLAGELYGPLTDPEVFASVTVDPEVHTVVWPNGADFDPETLHDWPQHEAAMLELAESWRSAAMH